MRTLAAILICLTTLPPLHEAGAAVVVTYRGSNPAPLLPSQTGTVPFDINADGIFDFQFHCNGLFAAFDTFGANRVSALIDTSNFYVHQVVPVSLGGEIGPGSSFAFVDPFFPGFGALPGAWHSADEIPTYVAGFNLGYATSGFMQYSNAYIGVEFMAADGVHYGWIQYQGFSVAYPFAINEPGGWVNSWGWETTPGMPIIAGSVPEAGRSLLLICSLAAILLRRRRALGAG